MDVELHLDTIYENNLDTKKFERLLDKKSQCYKCYWLEAIMRLIPESNGEISFEQIINEMIWEAWRTVTHFHLRLGPTVNGNAENFLEHAIRVLNSCAANEIPENPSHEKIIEFINKYDDYLQNDKNHLTDYVPYRLIRPFIDKEGKDYLEKKQYTRLIAYLNVYNKSSSDFFYDIIDGEGLKKRIKINDNWKRFMLDNYLVIMSWIQYNKAQFIQDRNPGVPAIIYKISQEPDDVRRLENARELWKTTVEVTGQPMRDIYTGKELDPKKFDLDHFVPRSYIANDELWNLTPMSKNLNSSKNNRLPSWKDFFESFAKYQFYLYSSIFSSENKENTDILLCKFEKCRRYNLNAIWASEGLYIVGNTEEKFISILEHNLRPVYDAAILQGYDLWEM